MIPRLMLKLVGAAALALALSGCSQFAPGLFGANGYDGHPPPAAQDSEPIGSLTYQATEELMEGARSDVPPGSAVLVTTLVNIDNLQQSSTLGRVVGELVANKLVKLKYAVQEVRLSGVLSVREGTGEIVLSRELDRIGREVEAKAIVVGTYGVGQRWVYVNLRVVAAQTGRVLNAVDLVLPYDADVSRMVVSR